MHALLYVALLPQEGLVVDDDARRAWGGRAACTGSVRFGCRALAKLELQLLLRSWSWRRRGNGHVELQLWLGRFVDLRLGFCQSLVEHFLLVSIPHLAKDARLHTSSSIETL
jgi:hypothetical protein